MPRLEEFPFFNTRPAWNISDWVDLQQTKNISLENKNPILTCDSCVEMKKIMPELEIIGLSVILTVCMADIGWPGMYVNIAPYGVTKLKEECDKLQRDVNDPALPTWWIKSTTTGGAALMAYPINYFPVEKPELGVGVSHIPVLEALRDDEDARNFPTSEKILTESAAFQRMTGETATVSTREITEKRASKTPQV